MSLAKKLCKLRDAKGMSLDDVATAAKISKTYLWDLEQDKAGVKRPSADVLLRIANALSTTLATLLSLETVQVQDQPIELPRSLLEFQERMAKQKTPLTADDLRDLAVMKFRGSQPQTADEWHQLYFLLNNTVRKRDK